MHELGETMKTGKRTCCICLRTSGELQGTYSETLETWEGGKPEETSVVIGNAR